MGILEGPPPVRGAGRQTLPAACLPLDRVKPVYRANDDGRHALNQDPRECARDSETHQVRNGTQRRFSMKVRNFSDETLAAFETC
jgi:hypothetical protein